VEWPARLQRLVRGPLVDLLRPGAELYLDGGHNEAAAEVLRKWAAALTEPLDLVFGMLSTKPPEAFLRILQPHVRSVRAITIPDEPLSLPAEAIAQAARTAGICDVASAADVTAAVRALASNSNRILICGSLYLAGRILADNS
jgi:dihydrofolate synthase/folylpolyglutamate synthase